jgi:hypothetical protein
MKTPLQLHRERIEKYLSEGRTVSGGATPSQWQRRKLTTVNYQPNQKQVIDLRKYETDGVFDRIIVRLTGSVVGSSMGAATGVDDPEGLLQNCTMIVTPAPQGLVPFNQVSGRTLWYDRALEDRTLVKAPIIGALSSTTATASITLDVEWHMIFQRRNVRKGIEYGFDMGRYTGAVLNLTFGDLVNLYTGSVSVWSGTVEIWADVNYNVNPRHLHAVELFENLYSISASNPAFLIDNLPNGSYYGDLHVLSEVNNALDNRALGAATQSGIPTGGSFDMSSGSRIWLQLGDTNADYLQRRTRDLYDGSIFNVDDPNLTSPTISRTVRGQFALTRLGVHQQLLTKAPEALTSQLLIKVAVTATATTQLRLFGRKIVPGGVYSAPAASSGAAS